MSAEATPDFLPGDPARHILGREEEKPARRHRPQPPKPTPTANAIRASVQLRIEELDVGRLRVRELEVASGAVPEAPAVGDPAEPPLGPPD